MLAGLQISRLLSTRDVANVALDSRSFGLRTWVWLKTAVVTAEFSLTNKSFQTFMMILQSLRCTVWTRSRCRRLTMAV